MKSNPPEDNRPYLNTYTNRVKQFEEDEKRKAKSPVVKSQDKKQAPTAKPSPAVLPEAFPANGETNPYKRARLEVLAAMEPADRTHILELEEAGKLDDRLYNEFIAKVSQVAEKYIASNN